MPPLEEEVGTPTAPGETTQGDTEIETDLQGEQDEEDRIAALENKLTSQMAQMQSSIESALSRFGQPATQQAPVTPLTDDELHELAKTNPIGVQRYLIQQSLTENNSQVKNQVTMERNIEEARKKYPINEPKFKAALEREIVRLMDVGGKKDNPKLLITACENAAEKLGMVGSKKPSLSRGTHQIDSVEVGGSGKGGSQPPVGTLPEGYRNRIDLYCARPGVTAAERTAYEKKITEIYRQDLRKKGR